MKKRFIRSLTLAMAVVTVAGCVGCGKGSNGNSNASVENNCYETGLPIAKDTVKLTVMIKDDSNGTATDLDKAPITK